MHKHMPLRACTTPANIAGCEDIPAIFAGNGHTISALRNQRDTITDAEHRRRSADDNGREEGQRRQDEFHGEEAEAQVAATAQEGGSAQGDSGVTAQAELEDGRDLGARGEVGLEGTAPEGLEEDTREVTAPGGGLEGEAAKCVICAVAQHISKRTVTTKHLSSNSLTT
mmetsp:Transcript_62328/g.129373  ORF Transcript_62328/g.129373 Transcript_62328/m.129373 type:complete len:169 (+) Transcript_62328:1151-1657(+)